MTGVVAIGDELRIAGYALAGVDTVPASSDDEARAAWRELPDDTVLLLLTPDADRALAELLDERPNIVSAVLPE